MVKFSIIIPVKAINDYVRETVPCIQSLNSDNWELLILPNEADQDEWRDNRIKLIPSGRVGPAAKRDLGAKYATGEILVFLDDDSYPSANLLNVATQYFDDESIVAIGGPAITPPNDSFRQKVSGAVFLSKFSGGNPERYLSLGEVKEIDDWPSVNFMVRKEEFIRIGGFDSEYWPGEDTRLCANLIKKTSKKILYIPNLIVWHHRREGLLRHLKQVGSYGLHRGYFAKRYPETSFRIRYFMPSLFLIYCLIAPLIFGAPKFIQYSYSTGIIIYIFALIAAFRDIKRKENFYVATFAIPYIVLTHLYYGFRFIQGLIVPNLVSKLR